MHLKSNEPLSYEEVLEKLGLSPEESRRVIWDSKPILDKTVWTSDQLTRLEDVLSKIVTRMAGRDWRRADAADRGQDNPEKLGPYDLFHRRTEELRRFSSFGDLFRWSESEYGWNPPANAYEGAHRC